MSSYATTWKVDTRVEPPRIIARDPRETIICTMSAPYKAIGVASDCAVLAAAPDLFECLMWALQYGTFDIAQDDKLHAAMLDRAWDVVKKAAPGGVTETMRGKK